MRKFSFIFVLLVGAFLLATILVVNATFRLHNADPDCRFSIIINGAVKSDDDHIRYWNAVKQKWNYLSDNNFSPDNIWVNYVDGNDRDGGNRVDGPSSAESITESFEGVAEGIRQCSAQGKRSEVYIFVVDHGINFHGAIGIPLRGGDIMYTDGFADLVRMLKDAGEVDIWIEMGNCFSGAFIDELKDLVDGIAASTGKDQNHYSTREYMTFEYHFIAALHGKYPDGNAVTEVPSTGNPWKDAWDYAKKRYKAGLKPREKSDPDYGGTGVPKYCGNGVVEGDEECDYKSKYSYCSYDEECTNECSCVKRCGNGKIDKGEYCDPAADPTGCDEGYDCKDCVCIKRCGNRIIDEGEECEPEFESQYCSEDETCNYDTCLCEPKCGNKRLDYGEDCDPSAPPPLTCRNDQRCIDCRCINNCGNGVIDEGEECDPNYEGIGHKCEEGYYCHETLCLCFSLG